MATNARSVSNGAALKDTSILGPVTSATGAFLANILLSRYRHFTTHLRFVSPSLALRELIANHALNDVSADLFDPEHSIINGGVASCFAFKS